MKIKTFYLSMALVSASMCVNGQTTGGDDPLVMGSCASYIKFNDANSLQADSIYLINKTSQDITVDAVAEDAWTGANLRVISKIQRQPNDNVNILNLDNFPQTEADGYATYKALWTDNGVYMFISVKDNMVSYRNPSSQWMNDAIEFYFAKERGSAGKHQVIIPAMVGITGAAAPLEYESGSEHGSQDTYTIYGFDGSWDETTFNWAIKKTAAGFDMEVYMDKDIVTNANSSANYGLDKMFAGDIAYDFVIKGADREGALNMLGNSNQQFSNSTNYGYFKMVAEVIQGINTPKDAKFNAIYNADNKEITITSGSTVSSVFVYNVAGQVMPTTFKNASISVTQLKQGIYMVKAKDLTGNNLGIQKVVVY